MSAFDSERALYVFARPAMTFETEKGPLLRTRIASLVNELMMYFLNSAIQHILSASHVRLCSGLYWIDPDGPGRLFPYQTLCDMDHDGSSSQHVLVWTVSLPLFGGFIMIIIITLPFVAYANVKFQGELGSIKFSCCCTDFSMRKQRAFRFGNPR